MTILLIKTANGRVYQGPAVMHYQLAEQLKIPLDHIVACGIIHLGKAVWEVRGPD